MISTDELKDGDHIQAEGTIFKALEPGSTDRESTDTEPRVGGDTAFGGGNKPATLKTGATILVALFVNTGDRVNAGTGAGAYTSRA